MPNRPSMTSEQKQLALSLRACGLPYLKIASRLGVSESTAFTFLTNRKPTPKPAKTKTKTSLLPPPRILHRLNSRCPIRKPMDPFYRTLPKPTRDELERRLAIAVRNTALL
jgi:hypothetical protein